MTITDRIEINPKVMLGKPVIRGTRVTVELILRKLSTLARNYGDVFFARVHAARRRGARVSFSRRTAKSRRVNVHWNGVAACS